MSRPAAAHAKGTEPARLHVELGRRGYDIVVGQGLLASAAALLKPVLASRRLAVVTDETVAALHLPTLRRGLAAASLEAREVVVAPGEASKDFAHLERVVEALLDAGLERNDTVLALGGGVIGDLAGFAASILRRGVAVVHVPTTLLAQVDSAIGGKTGINTRHGKNLVGTFHQPRLVLADLATLETLPRRELLAGYAEVVKYGLIDDAPFFAWLEAHGEAVCAGERAALQHAVVTSCAAKARIVAADEREAGERALFNLGHTFAHALEAETGYSERLLHGEAVAIGTVLAFDLSVRLGLCPRDDATRVRRHLGAIGLPTSPRGVLAADAAPTLLGHMAQDKKVRAGRVAFVLVRGIGRAYLSRDVEPAVVQTLLAEALGDVPAAPP